MHTAPRARVRSVLYMQALQIQSRNRAPSREAWEKIRKTIVKTHVDVSQHQIYEDLLSLGSFWLSSSVTEGRGRVRKTGLPSLKDTQRNFCIIISQR